MKKLLVFLGILLLIYQFNHATNQLTDSQTYTEDMEISASQKVISIPACAIKPVTSLDYQWTFYTRPDSFYYIQAGSEPFMQYHYAPLYLPHKAKVKKLFVFYTDNGDGPDDTIEVSLNRTDPLSGNANTLALVTTDSPSYPSSPNRRVLSDNTINYPSINNHKYVYYLYVYFWQGSERVQFHGAKIILK